MKSKQNGMKMTFEEVTPEMALDWISAVPDYQRRRLERRVAAIQWDIEHDLWKPTHQAFAFSEDGFLDDGQHRAEAIVNAGKSIWSWVCRGVPSSSYLVIDTGKPRAIDEATDVTKQEAALVRQLIRSESSTITVPSNQEIVLWRDAYAHSIQKVIADTSNKVAHQRVPSAPMRAAIVRATYHMTTDAYARFIHLLYEGSVPTLEDGDGSVLRLRDYLIGGFRVRSVGSLVRPDPRDVVHAKTEAALFAFIQGTDLKFLRPHASEIFPLPTTSVLGNEG